VKSALTFQKINRIIPLFEAPGNFAGSSTGTEVVDSYRGSDLPER